MFVTKVKLLVFVFSCYIFQSRGLEKLNLKENNIFVVTESAVRNITSKLFIELHLQRVTFSSKLRQYILVHNFLTSITLKGQKTLNKIVGLSKTDKKNTNNETEAFITIINEILNEDCNDTDDSSIAYNDDNFIQYVDEFLTNLDGFKENSGIVKDNYDSLEIKDAIIHILRSENGEKFNLPHLNVTGVKNVEEDDSLLNDNEFWVPEIAETRRIYRGDRTKIKHFPFMVSVLIFKSFQCGGSIIKSDLVITAASCVQLAWNNRFFRENPSFLSVRVGSNFYNGGGDLIPILEVYFPPEYNPRNLNHNIVVLRLLRKLNIRKNKRKVKKIEIDRKASPLPMNTDGITIVGWGAKSTSNRLSDPWSNQLAFAVLDVYHLQECQNIYSREYVTKKNFCAGFISKGSGACNHDLGGPGIVSGLLTGVISFGSPVCGTPDAPTVFTKVGYYAEWIDEIMEQDVTYTRRKTTLRPESFVFTPPPPHLLKTTIKLLPIITGMNNLNSLNPIPIQQLDKLSELRMLDDENLFKEFLATMFKSKEADEYKDLINDITSYNKDMEKKYDRNLPIASKTTKRIEHVLETPKISKGLVDVVKVTGALKMPIRNLEHYDTDSVDLERNEEIQESMAKPLFVTRMDFQDEIVSTPPYDKQASNDEIEENENYETEMMTKDQKAHTSYEREITTQKAGKKYTLVDENLVFASDDEKDSLENDIVKLIDNIDVSLSVSVQGHSSGGESFKESLLKSTEGGEERTYDQLIELPILEEGEISNYEQITGLQEESEEPKYEPLTKLPKQNKNLVKNTEINDDEFLTLAYLSDGEIANDTNDKIYNDNEDFDDDNSEGMEIPVAGFNDLILKNNESSSVLDFISKHELFDMLSEAINEVAKNKINK